MPLYDYRTYRSPYTQGIADLIGRPGQIAAERARNSGQLKAGIANVAGNTIGGLIQYQQDAPKREMQALQLDAARMQAKGITAEAKREQAITDLLSRDTPPTKHEILSVAGPERGLSIIKGLDALFVDPRKAYTDRATFLKTSLGFLDALPEAARPEAYGHVRPKLIESGAVKPEDLPEQYSPEALQSILGFGEAAPTPVPVQGMNAEGQAGTIFTVPTSGAFVPKPPPEPPKVTPPDVGSFADYVPRYAATINKTVATMTAQDIEKARESYTESGRDQTPQAPVTRYQSREVLNDDGKPVMANYDAVTGTYVGPDKQPISNPRPIPSALEAIDSRKFQKARPVLSAVSELSEKINTAQGLIAKLRGGVEKVKAEANYNDDIAEYDALVSGFTPMVARALGHTGVLTQQDVDSVKKLFPKPGESKTLRDRKVARLLSIVSELEGGAPAAAAPPPGAAAVPPGVKITTTVSP